VRSWFQRAFLPKAWRELVREREWEQATVLGLLLPPTLILLLAWARPPPGAGEKPKGPEGRPRCQRLERWIVSEEPLLVGVCSGAAEVHSQDAGVHSQPVEAHWQCAGPQCWAAEAHPQRSEDRPQEVEQHESGAGVHSPGIGAHCLGAGPRYWVAEAHLQRTDADPLTDEVYPQGPEAHLKRVAGTGAHLWGTEPHSSASGAH
jgi:hypothetical protein